MQELKRAQE